MKCVTSPRGTNLSMIQRYHQIITSSWCATLLLCAPFKSTQAQSPEGLDSRPVASAPAPDALTTREETLRRKEAELLRAISAGDSVKAEVVTKVDALAGDTRTDSVKISPPLQAPTTAVESTGQTTQNTSVTLDSGSEPPPEIRALQEMGNHPALEPKKIAPAPVAQQPKPTNRSSNLNGRKPDTFRRVDRDRETIESSPRLFGNSRTVSLQEIEAERERPAPLEYEAVATIAGRDATLRVGPRSADRTLGSAPRFSEVSIDYRTGDWYRVQTTSGLRGWIQGRNLLFDAGISHNSTVRIGAVKAENSTRQAYRR